MTCTPCSISVHDEIVSPATASTSEMRGPVSPVPVHHRVDRGEAGVSAGLKYEDLRRRREETMEKKWGRLAAIARRFSEEPQEIRSWKVGADGERRFAEDFAKRVGDRAILLNDRKAPRTRGNIDHIALGPSGVWAIDTKKYRGKIERRNKGGVLSPDHHLFVNGRDQTKLADALGWQVDAVRAALGGFNVPITPAICFIDAERGLFAKPFRIHGVWITWGPKVADMVVADGPLTPHDVRAVEERLAKALPPVVRAS